MKFYQPIWDDIMQLPNNLIIPKTEFNNSYVITNDYSVVFRFSGQEINNLCCPSIQWNYWDIIRDSNDSGTIHRLCQQHYDNSYILNALIRYYRTRRRIEEKIHAHHNIHSLFNLKTFYREMRFLIDRLGLNGIHYSMIYRFLELQRKRLEIELDLSGFINENEPVYLLQQDKLVNIQPHRFTSSQTVRI